MMNGVSSADFSRTWTMSCSLTRYDGMSTFLPFTVRCPCLTSCRAMSLSAASDQTTLRWAAPVVRLRRDVGDGPDLEARSGQRTDGRLPAGARTLHEDVNLAHAVLHGPAGGRLGGELRGERGRLARALEAHLAGGGPGDHRTGRVRDGHDGVVEGALDMRLPVGDVLSFFAPDLFGRGRSGTCL